LEEEAIIRFEVLYPLDVSSKRTGRELIILKRVVELAYP
jgi:hypothetical protein